MAWRGVWHVTHICEQAAECIWKIRRPQNAMCRFRSPTCTRRASQSQSTVAAEPTFFPAIPLQPLSPPSRGPPEAVAGSRAPQQCQGPPPGVWKDHKAGGVPASCRSPPALWAHSTASHAATRAEGMLPGGRRPLPPAPPAATFRSARRAGAGVTRVPGLRHVAPPPRHVIAAYPPPFSFSHARRCIYLSILEAPFFNRRLGRPRAW